MPKSCWGELLIDGYAIARYRGLGMEELLRVLPDLRSVRTKRKPQSDQVRLEVVIA
jgi:hypothetical protein